MKNKIINHPDQWIITFQGDFVRIKDSEIAKEEEKFTKNHKEIAPN